MDDGRARDDALIGQIRLPRKEAIWGDSKVQAEVAMTANGRHHSEQDMKGGFCSVEDVEDNVFDAPRPDCASSSIVHESRQVWRSQIALLFGGSVALSPVLPPILRAFAGKCCVSFAADDVIPHAYAFAETL